MPRYSDGPGVVASNAELSGGDGDSPPTRGGDLEDEIEREG